MAPKIQPDVSNEWALPLFRELPDGLAILDADGLILAANPALASLFALKPEQAVGQNIRALAPPERAAHWRHDVEQVLRGEWTQVESFPIQSDGACRPVQLRVVARIPYQGRPAVILLARDLSVFQTVERALETLQHQWELSFNTITDGLCILDHGGRVLRANRAMLAMLGCLPPTVAGRDYRAVFGPLGPPGCEQPNCPLGTVPLQSGEIQLPGRPGWYQAAFLPLQDAQGTPQGAILTVKDVSAEREQRENISQHEAVLRQAAKMEAVGRMAGGIAHDFNNLLTSIMGYGALVLGDLPAGHPQHDNLQEAMHAAQRATALARQLLDFSRDQQQPATLVQPNAVITGLESLLRSTLGATHELVLQLAAETGSVLADTTRLEQVLMNLVINARDAMPGGGRLMIATSNLKLEAKALRQHPDGRPGNYVLIEVSDTGHGITPEVLEHIYDPFFTTKAKGQGTGLGLATVYRIVHQLHGWISCYSEVKRGTSFKIFLPRQDAPAAPPMAAAVSAPPRGTETVLVVDDEANIANMLHQILSQLGYRVLMTASSAQALELSAQHAGTIDLLLTDIVMPDLNGPELARALARQRPEIKTLYMSGFANGAGTPPGIAVPSAAEHLQKPFRIQDLAARVRQILDRPSASAAVPARVDSRLI